MVLFPNFSVSIYLRGTSVKDSQGQIVNYNYTLYKTGLMVDLQPIADSEIEVQRWGGVDIAANSRRMWADNDANLTPYFKVVEDATGKVYECRGNQPWGILIPHTEFLLIPMQGGQNQ